MAGVVCRRNTWFAYWVGPDGRKMMKSTKIKVRSPGLTSEQTRKMAVVAADSMESVSRGVTQLDKAVEMLRSVAVLYGYAKPVPTVEDYLMRFPEVGAPRTEMARRLTFRCFLKWLGRDAKLPITHITTEHLRQHLVWLLRNYRTGTVIRHRENLSAAFNRAVDVDGYLAHSPMKGISLTQLMKSIGARDDSVARLPFTPEEMKTILYRFPQPYCDLAATSFYTGGLRLGDVCLLRWADVDFERGCISVRERKTERLRLIQLLPDLRERLMARRKRQGAGEYVFPESAHKYRQSSGTVSTDFTGLLSAFGITTRAEDRMALKGRRRRITTKCFHSIRHTVVSWARSNPALSPDVVRKTVGHNSDNIELRYYFTADRESQLAVLRSVADKVKPDEAPPGRVEALPCPQ